MPDREARPMNAYELEVRELQMAMCEIRNEVKNFHDQREERRQDLKEINKALEEIRLRLAGLPDEEHKAHHDFVRIYIEDHQQRIKARAAILEKIATGGIWATISGIAALIWLGLKVKLGV